MKKIVQNTWVTFTSFLITLLGVILQIFNENKEIKIGAMCCCTAIVLFVISYCIFRLQIVIKLSRKVKKKFINKYSPVSNFYYDLLRQQMATLTQLKNRVVDDDDFFKSRILNFCQLIHDRLNGLLNIDFAVCIKSVCLKNTYSVNVDEWKTKTVARIATTNLARRSVGDSECQKVIDNTSFYKIVKENLSSWAAFNIEAVSEQLEKTGQRYKNPDPDYKKYYKSTIVVPIVQTYDNVPLEIKTKLKIPHNIAFHYLGFLCLDAETSFVSMEDENFQAAINLMLPLGELLYQVFSEKILLEIRSHTEK